MTERTVTDAGKLREELAVIRARGWAQTTGERQPGSGSVAAPVSTATVSRWRWSVCAGLPSGCPVR